MSRRFGVIGGWEPATAVLVIIIASLSVWGAFLIYRAVKGQRRKDESASETVKEATGPGEEEEDELGNKSTGKHDRVF